MTKKKKKSLEEIQADQERAEKMLHYYEHREKILRKSISEMNRRMRTRRLCTRAGMLESFLGQPELLTDDQIMDLLRIAFRQNDVKDALEKMLKNVGADTI